MWNTVTVVLDVLLASVLGVFVLLAVLHNIVFYRKTVELIEMCLGMASWDATLRQDAVAHLQLARVKCGAPRGRAALTAVVIAAVLTLLGLEYAAMVVAVDAVLTVITTIPFRKLVAKIQQHFPLTNSTLVA